MICAWLHFDSYLTGFENTRKWRTLASSCIDGPAKRHASYHLLLRSQNGDIQIGPYTALPDEGTKDSFKNCEGIFVPVCQPGTDTPINFYPILKDCNFFHIAVHGEAPTTGTDGTAFPGFTTIYINGKKIGECASYVGNSIETVGQCARYSTGANSYGIQIFTDFRVYHMPEEFCTDTPSPQTQAILKHAIEPIQTYPKLRHTHEWKTFPPTLTKSKSRSALSDSTNHQEASMKKSSVAKVKREPSSTNFSAHLGKKVMSGMPKGQVGNARSHTSLYKFCITTLFANDKMNGKKLAVKYKNRSFYATVEKTDSVVFRGRRFSSLNTWAMHCARLVVPEIKWVDALKKVFFREKFRDCLVVICWKTVTLTAIRRPAFHNATGKS